MKHQISKLMLMHQTKYERIYTSFSFQFRTGSELQLPPTHTHIPFCMLTFTNKNSLGL